MRPGRLCSALKPERKVAEPRRVSQGRNTLQIVLGAIVAVWGAAVVIRFLVATAPIQGSGAYAAGQSAAPIFGVLLLLVGVVAVYRGVRRRQTAR
jgi:hypothetical protein